MDILADTEAPPAHPPKAPDFFDIIFFFRKVVGRGLCPTGNPEPAAVDIYVMNLKLFRLC